MSEQNVSETAELRASFYLRAVRKHLYSGLLVAVSIVACTGFFTVGQKRIYEATATIVIDPDPPRPLGKEVQAVVDVGNSSYWGNKEYFETQNKILAGQTVSREVARALGLQLDTAFIANAPKGQRAPADVRPVSIEEAGAIVNSRLKVESVRDSRLVNVSVVDADAERARRILSALLDVFLERNVDQAVQSTVAASDWLSGQTGKLKAELEDSELALHEYKKANRILSVSLDDQSNMLRGEMQQLNEALTRVSAKREELRARVHELEKVNPEEPTELPTAELLSNNVLGSLRQDYVGAKSALEALVGEGKGTNHPVAAAAAARIDVTRTALVAEVKNVQGALRSELASVTSEQQGIAGLFERAKKRAFELNMLEIEYRRLERSKVNTEKLYGLVLERAKESQLTGMLRFNNIRITEAPTAGRQPVRPRVALNLALGVLMGLLLGVGTAVARARLDQTIRSPSELESDLGLPILGTFPSLTERAKSSGYYSRRHRRSAGKNAGMPNDMSIELITHALPSSHAAECVRVVRTSLMFSSPDTPHKRILVTSGSPAEGKTTVAVSIAIAFAQAGQRVLLIDCDLRRARLHRIFQSTNSEGVTTALQSGIGAVERALIETEVPNLTLMPGGPHVPNPAELLQSNSFTRLLCDLEERFDRIVIDSPPVLAVADSAILAALVNVSVLVVRAGKTRLDVTRHALRKLVEVNTPLGGVVLNALEPPRWGARYNYYYYGDKQYSTYGYGANSRTA